MRLLLLFFLLPFAPLAQDTIPLRYLDKEHPTNFDEQMLYYYQGKLFTGVAAKGEAPNYTAVQTFESGVFNGPYYSYYDNGNIKEQSEYANGRRNGTSIYYFDNGQMLSRMVYANGIVTDTTQTWYKSGARRSWEIVATDKKYIDMADGYYENGNKQYEIRPTYYKKWHENGQIQEEAQTENNKPIGKVKHFNEKGKVVKIEWWENGEVVKTKEKGKKKKS